MSLARRSAGERRRYAIARANQQRRADLAPARAEMADLIKQLGWRKARPMIEAALGYPVRRPALLQLTKRPTARVLAALRAAPYQPGLFHQPTEEKTS